LLPWWVSWATAAGTIICSYLCRRLYWQGYVVGLLNQVLWTWVVIATGQWGLLAVGAFMVWNYTKGVVEWRKAKLR
jgi:hypothetical protein